MKDVNDLLNKTDPTIANGYDDIPQRLLKLGVTELAPTITNKIIQWLKYVVSRLRYPFHVRLKYGVSMVYAEFSPP